MYLGVDWLQDWASMASVGVTEFSLSPTSSSMFLIIQPSSLAFFTWWVMRNMQGLGNKVISERRVEAARLLEVWLQEHTP